MGKINVMKSALSKKSNLSKFLIIFVTVGLTFLATFFLLSSSAWAAPSWDQTDWSGGPSTAIFKIPWETKGGWNKYASAQGVIARKMGVTPSEANGFLISSIFDLGNRRINRFSMYHSGAIILGRGSNDPNAINLANWSEGCLADFRYVQYKIQFAATLTGSYVSIVYINDIVISVQGVVRDALTGKGLIGATINFEGYISKSSVKGKGNPYDGGYGTHTPLEFNKQSYKITASAPGYQTQTKQVDYNSGKCLTPEATVNFALSPIDVTPPPTQPQPPPKQPPVVSPPTPKPPTPTSINKVKLSPLFTQEDSLTTDLSKIKDPKKVENFILEVVGRNKIIFKETLDLSEQKTIVAFNELDKYIRLNTLGKIELDSKDIPALDKKATLIMFNLSFLWTPKVLVDGKENPEVVSNINYQEGTLTFDASHFTKFEAVPSFEILEPGTEVSTSQDQLIKIKGKISDPKATVSAKLNGEYLGLFPVDEKTGQFEKEISLKEGQNEILVSAVSSFGETQTIKRTINYLPPKEIFPYLISGGALVLLIIIGFGYWHWRRKKSPKITISA